MGSYRPEIDGLRAVAIISVVLFHTGIAFFSGGYVGVDIFFVISGYLITSIILKEHQEGRFSFLAFYERRARRILPAIYFMAVCVTLLCFAVMLPRDLIEYGKLLIYTVMFGANFKLAGAPSYFASSSHENPLLHMWSLAVEEQFYLVWPALLLIFLTYTSRNQARYLTGALFILSLAISTMLVWLLPRSAFYHLPSRGWELLTGAALAMGLVRQVKNRVSAEVMAAAGLALMLAPVVIYGEDTHFPGPAAIPPVLGCAMFIHAATFFETRAGFILKLRPITFIGLISYSLYLWHCPLLALGRYVSLKPLSSLEIAGIIAVAVVMSIISWRFVETPFRHRREPLVTVAGEWIAAKPGRLMYAALGVAAMLVASGSFFQESRGALWRLEPNLRSVLAESNGPKEKICQEKRDLPSGLSECKSESSLGKEPSEFVLWGDSHANHYFVGTVAALGNGIALTRGGCAPLINMSLVHENGKPLDELCEGAKHSALQRIAELKPKLVILAARWLSTDRADYVISQRSSAYLKRNGDELVSLQKTHENLAIGLLETIKHLKDMGIRVAVLGQVPELTYDASKCLILSSIFRAGDISRCVILKTEDVKVANLSGSKIFLEIKKKNPDVSFYSPLDEFCDEQWCHAERNGKILYFDQNHLNRDGSLFLANSIRQALRENRAPEVKTVNLQRLD